MKKGQKLGRYEIQSLIGSGGMGEVYLAKDPKIGRDVAIKVLPAGVAADRERLARFEQEAQAAGSLNHPNILAIYDVDSEDGVTYVVSELLTGETLRELMSDEPLPMKKALGYTLQAAHGLAAAHEKGIIHRDIKPENLMVTSDGRLKILDFGLAKLTEQTPAEAGTDIPTRRINTDAGTVMGTVGYMSPEQLRGRPVDARSDIFSLGAVVYEMLSGRKAFYKDSSADTISAVLREDPPDLSESNSHIDTGLERVVRRCLEKNREERFHSASDLAFAIEAISGIGSSGQTKAIAAQLDEQETSVSTAWSRVRGKVGWAIAALLLATLLGLGWMYSRRAPAETRVVRFTIPAPEKTTFGEAVAISPDGKRLAFVGVSAKGESSLWVRALDSLDAQQLPGTEGARFPFWSPDSRYIAFFATSKLKKIDAGGGAVQTLAETNPEPRGGTWGPDGTIIYSPATISGLFRISAAGGTPSQLTELDQSREETSQRWPSFLPDGRHYLYFSRGNNKEKEGVAVGTLDSKDTKFLFNSRVEATYSRAENTGGNGYLLFARENLLMAQEFNVKKLDVIGDAVPVAQSVQSSPTEVGPTANSVVSVSNNGVLVFRAGTTTESQLQWVDRSGKADDPIVPRGLYHEPMISPDGKKVLVTIAEGTKNQDLWLIDLARNVSTRLTFDPASDGSGIWSPDGSTIYFASDRGGRFAIYKKAATGVGSDELVYTTTLDAYPDAVAPDGRSLLIDLGGGTGIKPAVALLPLESGGTPVKLFPSTGNVQHGQFSPDGRWIAYASDESGRSEIYVQPFPVTGGKWQISTAGGDQPLWNPNGKEIVYMGLDRRLMSVNLTPGAAFEVSSPSVLFQTRIPISGITDERNNYFISRDGRRFLINEMIDEAVNTPLTVVVNWDSGLPR